MRKLLRKMFALWTRSGRKSVSWGRASSRPQGRPGWGGLSAGRVPRPPRGSESARAPRSCSRSGLYQAGCPQWHRTETPALLASKPRPRSLSHGRVSGGGSSRLARSATPQHHEGPTVVPATPSTAAHPQACWLPRGSPQAEKGQFLQMHCVLSARTTFSRSPCPFPHPAALPLTGWNHMPGPKPVIDREDIRLAEAEAAWEGVGALWVQNP